MKTLTELHEKTTQCGINCAKMHAAANAKASLGSQITEFFTNILNTDAWPPRWHCGTWSDFHGWLYIVSDLGIWASYFAIPLLLLTLVRKRKDLPFHKIFLLFVSFILLCGITHLMDAIIFWWPAYRLSALLRFITAVVSGFTVYALYRIIPMAFNLRTISDLEDEMQKRRVVEYKLAASEFLLSEAGRIGCVGGWEFDLVSKQRTWSKAVYDIFELPYDYDINTLNFENYVQPEYVEKINKVLHDAIEHGTRWDHEVLGITYKKNLKWVRVTGETLFDENGKAIKLRGIYMDIDKYKLTELALNQSLDITTQNNQQLKNFAHILSHNIRNHASNMALISSLVDIDNLDEVNAEYFDKMRTVCTALNTTLEDLSQAIKIKNSIIDSEEIDLNDMVQKIEEVFESDMDQHKAQIKKDFQVVHVTFPRIYLESILLNLVSNAIKYRKYDTPLIVELKTFKNAEGRTVLTCNDNGMGIDLNLHGQKIFGLYKTFHDRKDAHGVGLFLIKSQVESQNGQIDVESTPGEGTTFKITF
ncbi:hypothetical protein FPZ43_08695 [Mucilaginibacter pallidiroseus]|uniref:histidine kinase n=1 Tax=Mucilaginibacter pallidiroseus TaxID=2599295 RepID=A0A563UF88_9SPHI|nr:HAMP domain-containing sensor histidine kinase [Mucilaginibacter pallidiroseus]TWR29919.1 hypothetical protein FPZ43_08695 [Mucilaginibacter pallidiroseus]